MAQKSKKNKMVPGGNLFNVTFVLLTRRTGAVLWIGRQSNQE